MLIYTKTPLRVSFIGGGTDFYEHFSKRENFGFVFGMTVDLYIHLTLFRKKYPFGSKIKLDYKEREELDYPEQIQHPSVREVARKFSKDQRFELSTHADVPGGTGLGSSSAFCVGLISAFSQMNSIQLTDIELAQDAVDIERLKLGEVGGWQDQYFAAKGGCLGIEFSQRGVEYIEISRIHKDFQSIYTLLNSCLLLVPIGEPRSSSKVSEKTLAKLDTREKRFIEHARYARELYQEFVRSKGAQDTFDILAEALTVSSNFKLEESSTAQTIFEFSSTLSQIGVRASKICGAGESGFMLCLVDPDERVEIKRRVEELTGKEVLQIRMSEAGCQSKWL